MHFFDLTWACRPSTRDPCLAPPWESPGYDTIPCLRSCTLPSASRTPFLASWLQSGSQPHSSCCLSSRSCRRTLGWSLWRSILRWPSLPKSDQKLCRLRLTGTFWWAWGPCSLPTSIATRPGRWGGRWCDPAQHHMVWAYIGMTLRLEKTSLTGSEAPKWSLKNC